MSCYFQPAHQAGLLQRAHRTAQGVTVGTELDVSAQARLLDLLRHLVAELNLSAIVVTHDLDVVRLLAHQLMVMQSGRVVEHGLTDKVLDYPQHAYTQLLVSSILRV